MTGDQRARVLEVLQAALDRPSAEREAFVRGACGDDAAVRDSVVALLAEANGSDVFERIVERRDSSAGKLAAGARLGRYEVIAPVGGGGMGDVYRAKDTKLPRFVALKILHPRFRTRHASVERFRREADALAMLKHPNICIAHDVGREGDIDYLVMEFVEGRTLRERLSRGPLSVDETDRKSTRLNSSH